MKNPLPMARTQADVRSGSAQQFRAHAATILVAGSIWVTQLGNMLPGMSTVAADRGIFISVGERLLAGDRLYLDVWDNKEPWFFYFTALTRFFGPIGDYLGVLGVMLVTTWIAYQIASTIGIPTDRKLLLGGTVLILSTGACFWPGSTHAPGILLCLVILLSVLRNQAFTGGFFFGLLFFTKITMMPVAGLALVPWLWRSRKSWRVLVWLASGISSSALITLGILWARQEIVGYLGALIANLGYATSLNTGSIMDGIIDHLHRTLTPSALVMLMASLAVAIAHRWLVQQPDLPRILIRQAIWLSGCGSICALSLTGMWEHHAQTFLVGSTLALILLLDVLPSAHVVRNWLITGVAAVILGGGTLTPYLISPTEMRQDLQNLRYPPPTTRALLTESRTNPMASYARVGHNDDAGHAFGLRHLHLACPHFHQYSFDPPAVFDETLSCLPSADAIILAPSVTVETASGSSGWNSFVKEVENLISTGYRCQSAGSGRVCFKE